MVKMVREEITDLLMANEVIMMGEECMLVGARVYYSQCEEWDKNWI